MSRAGPTLLAALTIALPFAVASFARAEDDADPRRTPVVAVVERARPAVVNIYTETIVETPFRGRGNFPGNPFYDDFFSDFFGGPSQRQRTEKRTSLGSGVIVDADGTVVTNEHVIVRASTIRVLMTDKREFKAKLVGADSDSDLAVLEIEADGDLPFVPMPRDDDILVGETVVAIGNPYGLSHTVTVGVVSAVGRAVNTGERVYHDFIQTDASINPGNSGGPLINLQGRVLGINTAIHRTAEGIGFAIPAARARAIVDQIVTFGSVQPAWIGFQVQNLTTELAFHFGTLPDSGVLVSSVEEESPAQSAGIEPGQIVEQVNGERIRNASEFAARIAGLSAGDRLVVTVKQGDATRELPLEVAMLPSEQIDALVWRMLGLELQDVPRGRGVRVTKVRREGPAGRIGIVRGDAVTSVGGRDIDDLAEFRVRFARFRNSNHVLLTVARGRRLYRVSIPLDRRF